MGYGEQIGAEYGDDLDELVNELSGYGEEIGDDEDELGALIGALAKAKAKSGRARSNGSALTMALRKLGGARSVTPVHNSSLRRYPLGLGSTSIAAGATAVISANPQLPFKVERLVTPSTGLLIDNLSVGTVSQFVAAGAVPVEIFAPDAVSVSLNGDTAVPGVAVQITVSNPTGGALSFRGAIIGAVAQ